MIRKEEEKAKEGKTQRGKEVQMTMEEEKETERRRRTKDHGRKKASNRDHKVVI